MECTYPQILNRFKMQREGLGVTGTPISVLTDSFMRLAIRSHRETLT